MLNQHNPKTHAAKWTEAERELAVREFSRSPWPIDREYFPPFVDTYEPQTSEKPDPQEVSPRP